ncbi:MAG: hypothetical protein OIF35_10370, partial [Cellvibrionaceae bacterium]|nr:hypothetical protein [Cellvibrionaceae bacterium]
MKTAIKSIVSAAVLGIASLSSALADDFGKLQVHGFATQNFLYSDHNNFFGDSEDGSFEFYEIGLNGLWQATPRFKVAGQILLRDAGATDDGKLRADYLFADYAFWQGDDSTAGLRLGRILNPFGMYNDTRDVAHTRPSILLPQSIYFDVNRNLALSADGGMLYLQKEFANSGIDLQLFKLKPRTRDPDLEPALFFADLAGRLEGDRDSWLARLIYNYDLDRIRMGLVSGSIKLDYKPAAMDIMLGAGLTFKPTIAFAEYNAENWTLSGEYARRRVSQFAALAGAPEVQGKATGSSYFVQYTRRLNSDWEAYLRYDNLVWNDKDEDGKQFAAQTGLPDHSRYAKDWTLGLRWDVS